MDQLNRAYLPSLFLLQKHYAGRIPEQESRTHDLILRIARRAGIADRLTAYQQAPEPQLAGPEAGLRAKAIDRMLEEVPTGILYTFGEEEVGVKEFKMSFTEVNNANYQLFLEDLLRQRRFAYLDSAAVLPIDYARELGTEMDLTEELAKIKESHAFMPVMNISHRAAESYCISLGRCIIRMRNGRIPATCAFGCPRLPSLPMPHWEEEDRSLSLGRAVHNE